MNSDTKKKNFWRIIFGGLTCPLFFVNVKSGRFCLIDKLCFTKLKKSARKFFIPIKIKYVQHLDKIRKKNIPECFLEDYKLKMRNPVIDHDHKLVFVIAMVT
jgi:hypothetical protein